MCKQIRFVTAVALAVQDRAALSSFSAHDVTRKLREWVNQGEVTFTDKSLETIDGVGTYRVDHQEVRETFHELVKQDVLKGLQSKDNGRYIEWSAYASVSTPTPNTQQTPVPPPTNTSCTCAGQLVSQPTPLPPDADLRQKVQDYLKGRKGQRVTMKEVQSRFKGVSKTCQDWGKLIADMGLAVDTRETPSRWSVGL